MSSHRLETLEAESCRVGSPSAVEAPSETFGVDVSDVVALSEEHADLLATKWWTAQEFRRRGTYYSVTRFARVSHMTGVPCREGTYTWLESDRIGTVIREYQEVSLTYIFTLHLIDS